MLRIKFEKEKTKCT